jgi:hypothetical protein
MVIHGVVGHASCSKLSDAIVSAIGMTKVGEPHWTPFPDAPGAIATGTFHQPLGESSILIEPFPERNIAYLMVSSCKNYHVLAIRNACKNQGLEPGKGMRSVMNERGEVELMEPV